jgi:hypothetical protein
MTHFVVAKAEQLLCVWERTTVVMGIGPELQCVRVKRGEVRSDPSTDKDRKSTSRSEIKVVLSAGIDSGAHCCDVTAKKPHVSWRLPWTCLNQRQLRPLLQINVGQAATITHLAALPTGINRLECYGRKRLIIYFLSTRFQACVSSMSLLVGINAAV